MAAKRRRRAPSKASGPKTIGDFLMFSGYVGVSILALEASGALDWARKQVGRFTSATPAE